jgi:integrase
MGFLDGVNPMAGVTIPAGLPGRDNRACELEEVHKMLQALDEPARTIVATAAFTGLRKSELRGLRWDDFDGSELRVSRSVWHRHIGVPKTLASAAPVPVLPILARALAEHRARSRRDGFIFAAGNGAPLNLDNLARRVIRPALLKIGVAWYGWHSFRRGLATNLYRLGVADKSIQAILRHESVVTTLGHYVKTASADSHAAMMRLENALANKWPTAEHRTAAK